MVRNAASTFRWSSCIGAWYSHPHADLPHYSHAQRVARLTSMKKRTLGNSGLQVSALGYGCMGLTGAYGAAAGPAGRHCAHSRRGRARRDDVRHGRSLRSVHERRARRRGAGAVSRACRDCDEVRIRHQSRRHALRRRQPARAHSPGRRRDAEAAERGDHRPAVSAPRRSERPHRGRRGHREGTDSARQGEALRPVRGERADDPSCTRRSARRGRAERVLVVDARRRAERRARHLRGTRHRLRPVQSARCGVSDRARSTRARRSAAPTSAASRRASRRTRAPPTWRWSIC